MFWLKNFTDINKPYTSGADEEIDNNQLYRHCNILVVPIICVDVLVRSQYIIV